MRTLMIANILRLRRTLRQREQWTPAQLRQYQQRSLAALRAFAVERSPFYRRFHRGFAGAALGELPVLTKATLMDNFDEIATVRSPFIRSERLDAAFPISQLVARLNALQPDVLVAYASMIRALAGEQLDGRLRIAPRAVNSSSEVLTAQAREMATRAWRISPFNVYAATETGGIAAECAQHRGMHLFEDLVVTEVVDDAYRPVPPGQPGDRLLVTVLSSRTIPLIRYEMTDRVTLATEPCPDGLPLRLLTAIEGRTDDFLVLPAATGGTVRVHPVVFHRELDLLDAAGWQVRQAESAITVLVAAPGDGFDQTATEQALRAALATAGAQPTIRVSISVVDTIPAGAAGKRPLVVAHHADTLAPPAGTP